jgi:hypothetical protein
MWIEGAVELAGELAQEVESVMQSLTALAA